MSPTETPHFLPLAREALISISAQSDAFITDNCCVVLLSVTDYHFESEQKTPRLEIYHRKKIPDRIDTV